jgi:23S rRNA (pseudouridine1915-N3)-methyltransferase
MRLRILAMGRLRNGPEKDLIEDYVARFNRSGRLLGLGPVELTELEDKKGGGKAAEATLLLKAIPQGAAVIALDERGKLQSSPDFAADLAQIRHAAPSELIFVIGGADGLDPAVGAEFWQDGLAPYAGARHAVRTALPRGLHPRGWPVSPGIIVVVISCSTALVFRKTRGVTGCEHVLR